MHPKSQTLLEVHIFMGKQEEKIIDVNLVATYFNKNNINDLTKEAIALENNNQVGFYYLDKKNSKYN